MATIIIMRTPEQQHLYARLSGQLHKIGRHFLGELPAGAKSLRMKNDHGKITVEVYDGGWKLIGSVPNDQSSADLRCALQIAFETAVIPDPDGVVAIL